MVGVFHKNVTIAVAERVPHRRRTSEELVSVLEKLSYVGHLEVCFKSICWGKGQDFFMTVKILDSVVDISADQC